MREKDKQIRSNIKLWWRERLKGFVQGKGVRRRDLSRRHQQYNKCYRASAGCYVGYGQLGCLHRPERSSHGSDIRLSDLGLPCI